MSAKLTNFAVLKRSSEMYIANVKYKVALERVDTYLDAHRAFLDRHFAAGELIATGPQDPRKGGVIILRDMAPARVQEILDEDPFRQNGIADYSVTRCHLTKFADEMTRGALSDND